MQKLSGDQPTKKEPQKASSKIARNNNGSGNNAPEKAEREDLKGNAGKKASKGNHVNVGIDANEEDSDSGYGDEDPKKTANKKPSARNRPKEHGEKDDEGEFKKTTTKKASRKRKPRESDDSAGDNDEDRDARDQKKGKKTREKNVPKKYVESSQNRRSTRKKAK